MTDLFADPKVGDAICLPSRWHGPRITDDNGNVYRRRDGRAVGKDGRVMPWTDAHTEEVNGRRIVSELVAAADHLGLRVRGAGVPRVNIADAEKLIAAIYAFAPKATP